MFIREILVNILANAIFRSGLGFSVWWIFFLTNQRRFERFFGFSGKDRTHTIYLSNLWDPGITRKQWGEIVSGSLLHRSKWRAF